MTGPRMAFGEPSGRWIHSRDVSSARTFRGVVGALGEIALHGALLAGAVELELDCPRRWRRLISALACELVRG